MYANLVRYMYMAEYVDSRGMCTLNVIVLSPTEPGEVNNHE